MIHALVEYVAAAAVFAALTGLGALPARLLARACEPHRLLRLPLLAIVGWGLVSLISALAALVDLDQTWLARGLLASGFVLLVPLGKSRNVQTWQLGDLALLLVLVAPMGLLVASTPAIAYDEFAQWLPNTRYLVEHAHYWNWPDWIGLTNKPGYPNGSAVIALLASQLAGADVQASFKTFVVLLLGGFGAALAGLGATRFVTEPIGSRNAGLTAVALFAGGCLIAFIEPFMDPRIAFTAYTDTPSGLVVALAVLAASYGIGAARRGDDGTAASWFGWTGLLSLTLILLRQTNLVLIAAIAFGCGLLLLRYKTGSPRLWLRWAALLLAPPVIGAVVWQAHLWQARIGPDISPKPLAEWDWSAPLRVARSFFIDRLAGNPLIGGAALVVGVAALIAGPLLWRRLSGDGEINLPPPRVALVLTAIVGACFVVFLAWSYVAVFGAAEVLAAASLWRYLSELGPMLVLAGCCLVLRLFPRHQWSFPQAAVSAGVGFILLMLLPFVGRGYYRLDCRFPDVVAARAAVAELRAALEPFAPVAGKPARVAVVNPTMGDWLGYAMAFDLRWPVAAEFLRFRVKNEPLAATEAWAWDQGADALLDLTPLDRTALRAQGSVPALSLLGRPAAKGDPWRVVTTTSARPLPPCQTWREPGR